MMWKGMIRMLSGLAVAVLLLALPDGARAVDEGFPSKQIDRAKLSESFRNTGQEGGTYALGSEGYVARENASMMYPYTFSGQQANGYNRAHDNDCSKGQGVWILARDAAGNHYVTSSGPVSNSRDNQPLVPTLEPGGNLKLSNGEDHPIVKARLGYDTQDANAWFNSDRGGILEQHRPISEEPVEVDNYRENGDYTLPKFDYFPEEIVITRWKSDLASDPTGTGMTVTRYAYGWSHPDFDDFFIVELVLENTSDREYEEVYMGYMNYFSVSKPGHSWRKWNGYWSYGSTQWPLEDDRYQFTEAANYMGPYRGMKVSYQYDGDAPESTEKDEGEPYISGISASQYGYRAEGELLSPQYIGWGPVDVTPPFINDPDTYVPIKGTSVGGPDIPDDQPRYVHWWKRRSRVTLEFEPTETQDTVDEIWDKFITPGKPYDDNPIEGGPTPGERELQEQLHSQLYGPWHMKPGDRAKIVLVFAAGVGAEYAGPGGEPMDFRDWAIRPNASAQLKDGERALFNHIERGRLLYRMGYDLPNQPPNVPVIERMDVTTRPLQVLSNANGNAEMTWTDGADDAVNPDYTGDEARDIAGYRIYGTTGLHQTDPVPHAGERNGPWRLLADIKVKDPQYYSNGVYTWADENSLAGFPYWYNIVPYARGHSAWENINAQKNYIPGAQHPVPTTLDDLPEIVQKHVRAGLEASHLVEMAKHNIGGGFSPVIAASDAFDALQEKVLVVPNPWKDDGVHSFGALGDNNKRMRFINLPRLARISIYTAAGDLVVQVVHDGTRGAGQNTAEVSWSQRARSGTSYAAPGIFFFAVESLVPGQEGKVQRGSFLIIQ